MSMYYFAQLDIPCDCPHPTCHSLAFGSKQCVFGDWVGGVLADEDGYLHDNPRRKGLVTAWRLGYWMGEMLGETDVVFSEVVE